MAAIMRMLQEKGKSVVHVSAWMCVYTVCLLWFVCIHVADVTSLPVSGVLCWPELIELRLQ